MLPILSPIFLMIVIYIWMNPLIGVIVLGGMMVSWGLDPNKENIAALFYF